MRSLAQALSVAFCTTVPLVAVGCSARHTNNEQYVLIATNTRLPYWQSAAAGLQKAAQEFGVKAEMRGPANFDPAAEVQAFHDAAAQKPAGILVSVADLDHMNPEIDNAVSAGIPVITIDSDAPDSRRLYFIGTNNLQAGRLGGERMAAELNGKGNVVFFTNPQQPNLQERLKGYQDVFARFPGIKVVEVFDMQGDPEKAMNKTREYIGRTGAGKVDAFVCLEAAAGKDVAEALREANAAPHKLLTMDVDEGILALISTGAADGTIAQKPYTMAYLGLVGLDEIHHDPHKPLSVDGADPSSPYPAFIDTGVALVDKGNLASFSKHR